MNASQNDGEHGIDLESHSGRFLESKCDNIPNLPQELDDKFEGPAEVVKLFEKNMGENKGRTPYYLTN